MFNNPIDQGVRERETTMQPSGIDMRSSKLTLIDRKRLLHSAKKTNETPLVAVEETERARPTAPRFKRDRETVYGTRGDIQSPTSTLLDRKRILYDPKMNMASQFSSEEEERTRRKSLRLKDASTNLPINQRRKPKSRRLERPIENTVSTWQTYVASLALFKAYHGHLEVPLNYLDRNQPGRGELHLGAWVQSLRQEHRHKQNNPSFRTQLLSDRRIKILEAMGLEWSLTLAGQCDTSFSSPVGSHAPPKGQVLVPEQEWRANFHQACTSSNPNEFQAWATPELRRLSLRPRASLEQPHYDDFEDNFRMNLVALTLEQKVTPPKRRRRQK